MARTRLFGDVQRELASARQRLDDTPPAMRAINRRAALAMLASAAACTPTEDESDATEVGPADDQTVAIVGGGLSGLTAAWRLAVGGVASEIFEASGRTGGRMYTLRDFTPERQFCELGAEFVSSGDEVLIRLCGELGVKLEALSFAGRSANTVFDIGGKQFTEADLIDPASQSGVFLPAAARIAHDQKMLLDDAGEWTPRAYELDALPMSKYLDGLRGTTSSWVINLITLAWQSEFGMPVSEQSSLNLVDAIGTDSDQPFAMFGAHDEAFRIAGGSSALTDALTDRLSSSPLSDKVRLHLRHQLTSISRSEGGIRLGFRNEMGAPVRRTFSRIILTLPFTRLREVKGLGEIGLPSDKLTVIHDLGYGANAKLAVATSSRPWHEGLAGIPAPMSGTIYSDRGFELVWETSAAQPGVGGVLTNYLSGDAAWREEAQALARLETGLDSLSPVMARALTPRIRASFFWPTHPHTRGSYASCKTGQYTSFAGIAARPELDSRLLFAGEHTSLTAMGSMNGAVDAGERVARQILARDGP